MGGKLFATTALTTSSTLLAGAAWAAPPPTHSWTGCYIGVNAGGTTNSFSQSAGFVPPNVPGNSSTAYSSSGGNGSVTGGVQAGCNYQFAPQWMAGLESDFNALNRSHTIFFGGENTIRGSQTASLRWLSTVRGRFGYTGGPWLLFATVGLALGEVKSSVNGSDPPSFYSGSFSGVRAGVAAGGGVEYAFTDRLSGKIEYIYFDLGSANYLVRLTSGPGSTTWTASSSVIGNMVRAGLNYKFYP